MLKITAIVLICSIVVTDGLRFYKPRKRCRNSSECLEDQCCRDSRGRIVGDEGFFGGEALLQGGSGSVGYCSWRPSQPGQTCNQRCGCSRGHTCYRTITGACCPPRTCWTDEAARIDKEKWDNCFPPNCFFPPVANRG